MRLHLSLFVHALLGCLAAAVPPAATATAAADRGDALEARIDALFAPWSRSDLPGCALGVTRDGKIVYEHGYGMADLEQGTAIRPGTVFNIASLSKQFTTTAVALLEQDGKLSLEDDIRKYVPEVPDYGAPISLRQLANHTSGLRDYPELLALGGWNWVDEVTESRILEVIVRQKRTNFAPGAQYMYSNSGYLLLTMALQRVSGQSLGDFARDRIFGPLGMRHTRFYDDRTLIVPQRAVGYLTREDGSLGTWRPTYEIVGDGAVLTTVQDMALWERNFLHPQLGRDPQALIATLLRQGMLADGKTIDYALGLSHGRYRGLKTVSHSGSIPGYATNMLRFPAQRLAVFVLCNQGGAPAASLTQAVADLYLEGDFSTGAPTPAPQRRSRGDGGGGERHAAKRLAAQAAAEYAGRYYSEELDAEYRFAAGEDGLTSVVGHLPRSVWRAAGPDRFELEGEHEPILQFRRGADGRVDGFVLETGRVKGLGFVRRE